MLNTDSVERGQQLLRVSAVLPTSVTAEAGRLRRFPVRFSVSGLAFLIGPAVTHPSWSISTRVGFHTCTELSQSEHFYPSLLSLQVNITFDNSSTNTSLGGHDENGLWSYF